MNTIVEAGHAVKAQVVRGRELGNDARPQGYFTVEHWRNGKLLSKQICKNGVTNVGKNHWLGVQFHADTQITAWYVGLINNSGFSALADADTMSSHSGWTEYTGYSQSTRVAWGPGASASQAISNSSPLQFDITGTCTIYGVFVNSVSTKGGTTGTLWATAAFAAPLSFNNGDQLKVTYTVTS